MDHTNGQLEAMNGQDLGAVPKPNGSELFSPGYMHLFQQRQSLRSVAVMEDGLIT